MMQVLCVNHCTKRKYDTNYDARVILINRQRCLSLPSSPSSSPMQMHVWFSMCKRFSTLRADRGPRTSNPCTADHGPQTADTDGIRICKPSWISGRMDLGQANLGPSSTSDHPSRSRRRLRVIDVQPIDVRARHGQLKRMCCRVSMRWRHCFFPDTRRRY